MFRSKRGGKVRALVSGIEKKQVRFVEGTESPVAKVREAPLARLDPPAPPSPTKTVSAQLLSSAEAHSRGLQKTNDRLHDDIVALEIKADAAERSSRDAIDELTTLRETVKPNGLRRADILKMNEDNAKHTSAAIQASIKAMCAAQLEFLKLANSMTFEEEDNCNDPPPQRPPLRALDDNNNNNNKLLQFIAQGKVAGGVK